MVWDKQQALFGDALLDPSLDVPGFITPTGTQPSHKRFNVYRNNVMVSLTEAILDTYPVVAALVGDEFATAMARVYVGDHLPQSPVLLDYGEGFADFIAQFTPAQMLPFLADVARMEWAWLQAYHSADQPPLSIDALSNFAEDELGDLRFTFCPSVHLQKSVYPIVSIWSAHQDREKDEELEELPQIGEYALVNRPVWDVLVRTLSPAAYAFFVSLQAGNTLGVSIDKGQTFSDFDAAGAISALFETQSVAAIK